MISHSPLQNNMCQRGASTFADHLSPLKRKEDKQLTACLLFHNINKNQL